MENVSPIRILELHETFRIFDKDGDGAITKQELGTVMRNLGQCPSEEELQQLLNDIDINGNNSLTISLCVLRFCKR